MKQCKAGFSAAVGTVSPIGEHRWRGHGQTRPDSFALPVHLSDEDGRAIAIRVTNGRGERSDANRLIDRKYARRGYGRGHEVPISPNCATFTAAASGAVVGTLSLTVDSAEGLASDRTFKDELDRFRAVRGAKLCELTKFACDTEKPELRLLAALFHVVFIYGTQRYDCTDLFIEVNPRHRRFYETMLGFTSVGRMRTNEAVGAPSHLMWLRVSDIRCRIDAHARHDKPASRSLYRYFLSQQEELGIFDCLATGGDSVAGHRRFRPAAAGAGARTLLAVGA